MDKSVRIVAKTPGGEPAGRTGMAARTEACLFLLACQKHIVRPHKLGYYATDEARAAMRAELLTDEVLWQLAACSDAELLAIRGFGRKSLNDFRTRYPQQHARPKQVTVALRADDV